MRVRKIGTLWTFQNRRALQNWLIRSTLVSVSTWIGGPTPAAAQNTGNQAPTSPSYVGDGCGFTEINTMNNSAVATLALPNNANGVVVMPDGTRIYATNRNIGQVAVFSPSTNVPKSYLSNGGS
jgi:DNA-binding beta-propeller fold protein YncE